jgi:hypothetical protein
MVNQLAVISDDVLGYIHALKRPVGIPATGTGLLNMERTVLKGVKDGGALISFKADGQDQSAKVGSRTRITIGRSASKRDSLKTGMSCEILYAGNGEEARSIRCE